MHEVMRTNTGRRFELHARVASSVLFAAALVGLFLPWDRVGHSEIQTVREFLLSLSGGIGPVLLAAVVALFLGVRGTRGAAFARAIIAAVGVGPFAFIIGVALALGGDVPEIGGWVSFWALVGAFITNVIIAIAGFRRGRGRPSLGSEGGGGQSDVQ